jgi:hypothetical protein
MGFALSFVDPTGSWLGPVSLVWNRRDGRGGSR